MAVVAVLWRIWRSRNWVVFKGKQFGFPALMRQFSQQYEEWVGLPVDLPRVPSPPMVPRSAGSGQAAGFTCQWDRATRKDLHSAGGMVLLSPSGDVLMAHGIQFQGIDDPVFMELLVLREAITWCLGQGFTGMRFEGDAKIVIDKINCKDARDNRMGSVPEEVFQYCRSSPGISVRFIGRSSNRVAHLVARKALSLYPTMSRFFDFRTWLGSKV
ncbi:unnamed protein product [Linum trigynum]